ncbi:glyoxalase [Pullulanibacillus pueri]|uniref:Glyoxalase n=1 Tax=Pullulanibacillus pueri TaxID=1437324 RepID=A0A8J2ZYU5_9BACL|nr:glyoxalase [Pullulanibacillus pueri]GGH86587.1 glyoxalase [Pullulanibacillus pueri]
MDSNSFVAILPSNDIDASEAFYAKLGFKINGGGEPDYRILSDGKGARIHLTQAVEGWLIPGRNPFGVYLYSENVDALAKAFGVTPENKPWGMYEFALSDPDETLVRIGGPLSDFRKLDSSEPK